MNPIIEQQVKDTLAEFRVSLGERELAFDDATIGFLLDLIRWAIKEEVVLADLVHHDLDPWARDKARKLVEELSQAYP